VEAAGLRVWNRLAAQLENHNTSLRSLYGDGWSAPALKPREFQVLSAAALLDAQGASGTLCDIYEAVEARGGRVRSLATFITVKRLEWRGLLKAESAPAHTDNEWRPRFQVTEDGQRALARARAEGKTLANVREDLLETECSDIEIHR